MKYSWRKAVAFVVALTLVAGYAMPANVDTGGFFGGTTIIAHAADEVSENISLVNGQSLVLGTHYSVSGEFENEYGIHVYNKKPMTINARKGETITKVVLTYSWGNNKSSLSASAGTFDGNATISDINAQQVTISSSNTSGVKISAVRVYFEGSLSNPTVTLTGGANAKSSGGLLTQSYLPGAMDTVTYTALTGATFPEFETYMLNGVTVERTSDTVVTISGTPTANTAIIVPDAVSSSKIVTWNSATISSISSNIANDYTYTANGITLNKTGKGKFANNDISVFNSPASFEFTTATGKFTNIEIAARAISNGGNWTTVGNTLKWNGTPSNSVSLSGNRIYVEGISSITFVIEMPADLSNATVTLGADNTVSSVTVGGNEITDLSEFDITYGTDESHTATEPPTEDGTYYAYVTAKTESENYTGTAKSEAFTVVNTITLNSENVTIADFTYDGTEKTPVLKYGDTTLVKDTDYTVDAAASTASATNADTYTIKINGINNYAGENVELSWTINKKAVTITAGSASKTYDGSALTNSGFTASDLETGDTHTFTVAMSESSTITNAGTQDNVIATVDGVAVTAGTATAVGNYSVTAANGTLTVNRKAVTITADSDSKTYDGTPLTKNSFTASALEAGDMHSFNVVMSEGSTITNAGTQANVIATVDGVAVTAGTATEVGNYSITATNGTLTVNKANSSPDAVTGLTAAYGSTLADVTLPDGWAWDAPATSVGNVGNNDFSATFTPTNTNYNNYTTNLTVAVTAIPANPAAVDALDATYGQTLADVALPTVTGGTWAWKDAATTPVGNAGTQTFTAVYTPTSANYTAIERNITINVAKANPTANAPTGLTATYEQTLADVIMTNPTGNTAGSWAWNNNALSVGDVGNNQFTATFTPNDSDNYNIIDNVNVTITVGKAVPAYDAPVLQGTRLTHYSSDLLLIKTAGSVTDGQGTMYYAVTENAAAPDADAVDTWKTDISDIKATKAGTYYVWYKITGADNYELAPTQLGSVTVSQYSAPSYYSQTWTLTMDSYEYDGTAHTPTINGKAYTYSKTQVRYTYYNADTNEELDGAPSAIGNYRVEVYADGGSSYYGRTQEATYSITAPTVDKDGKADVALFKDNDMVPESEGKIFAGWFTDETCTTAYTGETGKAYAKFIDEKILTVKAQISSGTTANSEKTSIRFITSVDSLKYQNVGFKITFNGKTIDQKMTKVYSALNANGKKISPTVFSEDSHYMEAYTLNNIPKSAYGKTFTVTPYYTTQDGTIVDGATNAFTIANMIK